MRKIQLWFYSTMAIIMFTASCVGCVSIEYRTPNDEVFKYKRRLGAQEITGLKITKDKDGLVSFELDTQKGTEGKILSDVAEALKNITVITK